MRYLYETIRLLLGSIAFVTWIAGFVLAKGWISTIACFFPLYAWYLVVEAVMLKGGLL